MKRCSFVALESSVISVSPKRVITIPFVTKKTNSLPFAMIAWTTKHFLEVDLVPLQYLCFKS